MDRFEQTSKILKGLARPVRFQTIQLLEAEGEACVCNLEASLDQRQSYISQQLAKLREVGLVEDRRDGLNVFYALSTGTITELIDDPRSRQQQWRLPRVTKSNLNPYARLSTSKAFAQAAERSWLWKPQRHRAHPKNLECKQGETRFCRSKC